MEIHQKWADPTYRPRRLPAPSASTPPTPEVIEADRVYSLSPREVEVLEALMDGKTLQETSEELYLSLSSVKNYLQAIKGKLDYRGTTTGLVVRAIGLGIVSAPKARA